MAVLDLEPTVAPTWGTGAPPPMPSEPPQRMPNPAPAPAPAPQQTASATPPAATQGATQAVITQPTAPVQPVAASEPLQAKAEIARPIIDPRPLKYLEMHDPKKFELVKQIANDVGISPTRFAAHWYLESSFGTDTNLRNKEGSGAMGPMQLMPNTAKELSEGGKFDVNNFVDHMRMGAHYIKQGDQKYGPDTVSSVAYYQAGPGNVNAIAGDKERAERQHPNTFKYLREIYAGQDIKPDMFVGDGKMTPQGLVRAGVDGGHDAFVQYIAAGAPAGMPLSDAWQHAEALLTKAFLMKGDIAGAQHARDFVLQMSHTGSNQYLMAAHQALSAGDGVGAAKLLAKAHAFFPDGTAGQFGITGNGEVWGMRVDEHDSKRVLGKFKITPDHIAGMLNQTRNPQQYLKTLNEQQKTAGQLRHWDALGKHYQNEEQLSGERNDIAREEVASRNADRLQRGVHQEKQDQYTANRDRRADDQFTESIRVHDANIAAQNAQIEASRKAQERLDAAATAKAALDKQNELEKEIPALYGADSDVGSQPRQARATMGDIHKELRHQGAHSVAAESVAKGLFGGKTSTYQLMLQPDGRFGVVPRGAPGQTPGAPVYYLSPNLGARLMPPTPKAMPTGKPSVAVP